MPVHAENPGVFRLWPHRPSVGTADAGYLVTLGER